MCSVSMITGYGLEKVFPGIITPAVQPSLPSVLSNDWVEKLYNQTKVITLTEYNELIRKAKEFDAKTNQPECPDPEKIAAVEEFCKKFELMGTEMFRLANDLRNLLK